MSGRRWTEDELATLGEHYRERGSEWEGWAELLPGRSAAAIGVKASEEGLTKRKCKRGRWSADEERALLEAIVRTSKALNRSPMAIIRHGEYLVRNADRIMRVRGKK